MYNCILFSLNSYLCFYTKENTHFLMKQFGSFMTKVEICFQFHILGMNHFSFCF